MSFIIFRDWLSTSREDTGGTLNPVLRDAYKLWGFVFTSSQSESCTMKKLQASYRNAGLKNTSRRNAAMEYLVEKNVILTADNWNQGGFQTAADLAMHLFVEYGYDLQAGDFETYLRFRNRVSNNIALGKITAALPENNIKDVVQCRLRGYQKFDTRLVERPGIGSHAGRKLAVYVFLALEACWAPRTVSLIEKDRESIKVNLKIGETIKGSRTIAKRLQRESWLSDISHGTVDNILNQLEKEKLIYRRGMPLSKKNKKPIARSKVIGVWPYYRF